MRYWVELLAAYGPPRPDVSADGPYGLAFAKAFVAVNPTGARRTVTFHAGGKEVGRMTLDPGASAVRPR